MVLIRNDIPVDERVINLETDARVFWEAFAKEYFESDDLEVIEQLILPYAGLKVLIIERDTHFKLPEFHAVLEKTILK